MSTHNLCFRAKIRKNVYPCTTQFYYTKVGCKGVFVTRTCFRDVTYIKEYTKYYYLQSNQFFYLVTLLILTDCIVQKEQIHMQLKENIQENYNVTRQYLDTLMKELGSIKPQYRSI